MRPVSGDPKRRVEPGFVPPAPEMGPEMGPELGADCEQELEPELDLGLGEGAGRRESGPERGAQRQGARARAGPPPPPPRPPGPPAAALCQGLGALRQGAGRVAAGLKRQASLGLRRGAAGPAAQAAAARAQAAPTHGRPGVQKAAQEPGRMRGRKAAPAPAGGRWAGLGMRWRRVTRIGPGPSKLAYRLRRTWAKPAVRSCFLVYLPMALLGIAGWRAVSDDALRARVEAETAAAWTALAARPEFALQGVAISGASARLRAAVHGALALPAGQSSLGVSVGDLRARVEALGAVQSARVQLDPEGILRVHVVPRDPVALWRDGEGRLASVAADGTVIAGVARRAAHPSLPVLVGEGARAAVGEALALMRQAPEITGRLRAFVRVGERRWDMVLERDVRVMLPAEAPGRALEQVQFLDLTREVLERDIAAIDLRVPGRTVLRLTERGEEAMRLRRAVDAEAGKDT
ncbi:MAG: cell division protein FtsQ/DivIB [Pseudomonadota bacterium]